MKVLEKKHFSTRSHEIFSHFPMPELFCTCFLWFSGRLNILKIGQTDYSRNYSKPFCGIPSDYISVGGEITKWEDTERANIQML